MAKQPIRWDPPVWVQCSCGTAYAYRRMLSFTTGGYVWSWSRDCKNTREQPQRMHKPQAWNADGVMPDVKIGD